MNLLNSCRVYDIIENGAVIFLQNVRGRKPKKINDIMFSAHLRKLQACKPNSAQL